MGDVRVGWSVSGFVWSEVRKIKLDYGFLPPSPACWPRGWLLVGAGKKRMHHRKMNNEPTSKSLSSLPVSKQRPWAIVGTWEKLAKPGALGQGIK